MPEHLISILVRSKNDEAFIGKTLKNLFSQQSDIPFEVVNCDDASTDRTPEIIASFSQVISVKRPDGDYFPGRTLNNLVRYAKGDIIVFNNADAIPQNNNYLREIVRPLLEGNAEAVYGNQLARSDAQCLVKKDNLRAFGDGTIAATWRFFFSLAASATMKSTLMAHPFDEKIKYSEDVFWAYSNKLKIAYAKDALVEHSHNYTIPQLRKRFYGEGYADAQIFGEIPSFSRSALGAFRETLRDWAYILKNPSGFGEFFSAPIRRWTQKMSYLKGARDYSLGRKHK